ncbi:MAG: hypothetical protein HC904_16730 [Blastochloris sp.]|nr:hypothetical protein [Blastochloris sp.]
MNLSPQDNPKSSSNDSLRVLVERLEVFTSGYLEQAEKMNIPLDTPQILDLVDRAILTVQGVEQAMPYEQTVQGYFLDGMLEDLLTQPESIYEQVTTPEGETVYAPLSPAIWLDCLKQFRLDLLKLSRS